MVWKLEETIKSIAPVCEKHQGNKDNIVTEQGLICLNKRIISEQQLYKGWESDFTGHTGIVDIDLEFFVNRRAANDNSRAIGYAYDLKTPGGTEVTHSLQVELIVSKKYAPEGKAHLATGTGTGRTLGMNFTVILASHPGSGVSWENETPPSYVALSPSLPRYNDMEEIDAQRAKSMNGAGQ